MEKSKNWPAWFYGPDGASGVFTSPTEVPDEWQAHPKHYKEGRATVFPGDEVPEDDDGGDDDGELPEFDDITKEKIKARLDALDIEYDASENKPELYELLKESI